MLHQLTIKNFKSFKDEVTLDLTATALKELPADVVVDVLHERVLKLAALYGANASGKTTVIRALSLMRALVRRSFVSEHYQRRVTPYWFSDGQTPTEFSVLFSTETNIFQYGFGYLKGVVTSEFLYQRDKSKVEERYLNILDRTADTVTGKLMDNAAVQAISPAIGKGSLFLSALANLDIPIVREVSDWFEHLAIKDYGNPRTEAIKLGSFTGRASSRMIQLLRDPKEKVAFENFSHAIDVGIEELGVIKRDLPEAEDERFQVVTFHRDPRTDKLKQTSISDESSGTRKMLMLYVDLKQVLDTGGTLLVDELDAKLHPLLLRYVLLMFHNTSTNPHGAQLIFTTQELYTLDRNNFRRDEVWFVDKNQDGVSDLYSLDTIVDPSGKKVRNDASYGKDYILGKYRAVPALKPINDGQNA